MPVPNELGLNERAWQLAMDMAADSVGYKVTPPSSQRAWIDCGVGANRRNSGLENGLQLAEICLAGLGWADLQPYARDGWSGQAVHVHSDHPVAACLASQYAGWQLKTGKFFAMGSGPMRAAARREPIFADLGYYETPERVVGVLETSQEPPDEIYQQIAEACGVTPDQVLLLGASTASLAGTIQVVARSLETALHKLHELKFDLNTVISGFGVAPLPPIAKDDLTAIGWTNDAVLYGGEVTLWVDANDDELATIGPQVPSSASPDFGEPFGEIFKRYNGDFYKIDPLLFSPAVVTFHNLSSGRTHRFGQLRLDVLKHWSS
jgi:methenyltetrahydromethanopterin cyclohydrolase